MTKSTRYFIQPGNNLTDFSFEEAPEVTLAGHNITVKGTSDVDYLYVAGQFHLDFSESLSGQDIVFVRAMRSAYTPSVVDGTLELRIGNTTSLRLNADDVVVFEDGKTVVTEWMAALNANTPAPALDPSLKSPASLNEVAQLVLPDVIPNALVRAFGGGDEGNTFGQVQPGMSISIKGTTAMDVVFVKPGTFVDFSESLGGEDKLYFMGKFTEYRFTLENASLKLARGGGETVTVLASTDDRLIFSEGTVLVVDVVELLPTHPTLTYEDLGEKWSTKEQTPGFNKPPNAVKFDKAVTTLKEDASTPLKLAVITLADDGLGENSLSLRGADASLFAITDGALYLRATTKLDYETKSQYTVTVSAIDSTIPGSRAVSSVYNLEITNANDAPVASADAVNWVLAQGVPVSIDLRSHFSDVDVGDRLTYSIVDALGHVLPSFNGLSLASGVLQGSPAGLQASSPLVIRATDAGGLFVEKPFSLSVVSKPIVSSGDHFINATDTGVILEITHNFTVNGVFKLQRADGTDVRFTVEGAESAVTSHTFATASTLLRVALAKSALVVSGPVADGDYGLKAVFNPGGENLLVSDAFMVKVDSVAPSASLSASLASDTGMSGSDGITSKGVVSVGALAADASGWAYSTNSGSIWAMGSASAFTLLAGSYAANAVQVRQFDAAGNSGPIAKLGTMVVDATAPSGVLSASLASDTGMSSSDRITANGAVNVSPLAADASGLFTLPAGSYAADAIQIRRKNEVGPTGPVTKLKAVVVDTTAPSGVFTASLVSDTGVSSSDGITANGSIRVSALAADASGWAYSTNSGASWTTGMGNTFSLATGSYAANVVQVRQFDLAGNSSPVSRLTEIRVLAPPNPFSVSLATDTGLDGSDGITATGVVNVSGLAPEAISWRYTTNGGGNWSTGVGKSFTLAEGTHAANLIQVTQYDVAGNSGSVILSKAIVVDTTAPSVVLNASLVSDTGASHSDGITAIGLIRVSPLAADASGWAYSTNGGTSWASGVGDVFSLAVGSYAAEVVQIRQFDTAGNISPVNKLTEIRVLAPLSPISASLATDTGVSGSDGVTSTGVVNVSGLAANALDWSYTLDGGGSWSFGADSSLTLPEGVYGPQAIQIVQVDAAGNSSSAIIPNTIVVDQTAPGDLTVSLANDNGRSNSDGVTTDGTIKVDLLDPYAHGWEYSINYGGSWSRVNNVYTNTFSLSPGTYAPNAIQVRQFDLAGNRGDVSTLNYMNGIPIVVIAPIGSINSADTMDIPPNDPAHALAHAAQFFGGNNLNVQFKVLPGLEPPSFWSASGVRNDVVL